MSINKISVIVSCLIGAVALAGVSWGGWDIKQQVVENTSWRLIQTYERLELVRKSRRLSQIEWQKWCQAGLDLRVFNVCPSR